MKKQATRVSRMGLRAEVVRQLGTFDLKPVNGGLTLSCNDACPAPTDRCPSATCVPTLYIHGCTTA
jgi:hypothetical protein